MEASIAHSLGRRSTSAACPPSPFEPNCTLAYRFAPVMQHIWEKREAAFADRSCHVADAGFSWNCLGVVQSPTSCASRCAAALQLLAMETSNPEQNRVQAVIVEHDMGRNSRLGAELLDASTNASSPTWRSQAQLTVQNLQRSGFSRIPAAWRLGTILSQTGTLQTSRALLDAAELKSAATTKPIIHKGPVTGIEPLIAAAASRLLPVARTYLATDAELSGFTLFRLPGALSQRDYYSGHWHHDCCGRRLKAYIFLQNVTADTHPTQVAVKSHETLYYSYHRPLQSRFTEQHVQANYDVVSMLGRVGEGFVFDTNSIHRALTGNGRQRDALMLEFNAANKSAALRRLVPDHTPPCPSDGLQPLNMLNLDAHWAQARREQGDSGSSAERRSEKRSENVRDQLPREACTCIDRSDEASWAQGKNFSAASAPCVTLQDACMLAGRGCCVPIEPLPARDWRRVRAAGATTRSSAPGPSPEQLVVLRPTVVGIPGRAARRLVYVDLGANAYNTSIAWFRSNYPHGDEFEIIAFEASRRFDADYVAHDDVTLHHFAVWTTNTTMHWGNDEAMGRLTSASQTNSTASLSTVETIDLAEFLERHIRLDDFLVLKMDVEGAEYDLVPHLLSTGASRLVDELLVEGHTNINTCCRGDDQRHFYHARQLVQRLRDGGVFAHMWG